MTREWAGRYWGGGLEGVGARLSVDGGVLVVEVEGRGRMAWPVQEIRRGSGSVGSGVRLERGGEVVFAADESILGALGWKPHGLWAGVLGVVGLALLLIVGLAAGVWFFGIPWLAVSVARAVPVEWEQRLGQGIVDGYVAGNATCAETERAAQRVVDRMARGLGETEYEFRVRVVDSPVVNALAAPGGGMVVFRGLIEKTRSVEELAAVLAHEITHVAARHSTQAIVKSGAWWALVGVVTGDPSGLGSQTVALLGQLHFAREQEEEADAGARQLLEKARVDPKAMARIFKRMQGEEAAPPVYLSTHPRMAERIAEAEKWAETARYRFEPMGIELPVGGCAAGR